MSLRHHQCPAAAAARKLHRLARHLSIDCTASDDEHGFPRDPADPRRRVSPAAERNKAHISATLRKAFADLKPPLRVLEIASGTGQHVAHYAKELPHTTWQPTEYAGFSSPMHERQDLVDIMGSIDAYCEALSNVAKALPLDASADSWGDVETMPKFDALLAANILHISETGVKTGIFAGASRMLKPSGLVLIYGPFILEGDFLSEGNEKFDAMLKEQTLTKDAGWGLMDVTDVDQFANGAGFTRIAVERMPANNSLLIYKKGA